MTNTAAKPNLVKELRPGFIHLSEVDGVDFQAQTITRHPDFTNPKALRKGVLKTLTEAPNPLAVPPIEIYVDDNGLVHALDGDHRIINALRHCEGDQASSWAQIRAYRFKGTRLEAQIRAAVSNLEAGRANLDDGEVVAVVERCREWGMSDEDVIAKIGRGNRRFITKIDLILNATPTLLAAVKAGEVDIDSGAEIAARVPLKEQSEAVEEHKEAVAETGDHKKAREVTGVQRNRTTMLKLPEVQALLWPDWENYVAMQKGQMERDGEVIAFVGAVLRVLKITPDDGLAGGDGEFYTIDAIYTALQPVYEAYVERQNNPPRTRSRKAK